MQKQIDHAIHILRAGGLIALPTETVYGLAADATNPEAIKKIFKTKGRPADHPVIVHIASDQQLTEWADMVPEEAQWLARTYWPGPLTLVLKKASAASFLLTGGQDTIGLRSPKHPMAQAVLQAFGRGLASPSANRFGCISPTSAKAVQEELGDAIDLILDGGECAVGIESTIIDLSGKYPVLLRPGFITQEALEKNLNQKIHMPQHYSPRVSGALKSHYAPKTRAVSIDPHLLHKNIFLFKQEKNALVILTRHIIKIENPNITVIKMPEDPDQYAHVFYQRLRDADHLNAKKIMIEWVPETSEWTAIRDRLKRATTD